MLGLGMLKAGGAPESVVVLHLRASGFGTVEVRSSSASAGEGVVCKRRIRIVRPLWGCRCFLNNWNPDLHPMVIHGL
jgi:hypothetical protein